ncbi:YdeI/OmpD-associated family protein [Mumia sp. DW29H23]|uniref:YdeI/OmpD-associated family protein n=1 Tax=Mumia sp. DW29H23 TaxID=3421241 RepID=UPI003D6877EE
MRLTAELEATGGTTTGFRIPESFVDELGGGRRPKVAVTVKGATFRTSIAKMGEDFWLGLSAARREEAQVAAGEVLDLEIVLDTAPREIEVPDDLAEALAADPEARRFWDTLSFSKQRWHVEQATGAKKPETRAARVEKSVRMLHEGRAR